MQIKIKKPLKRGLFFWSKTAGDFLFMKVYGKSKRMEFFFGPLKALKSCQNPFCIDSVWIGRAFMAYFEYCFFSSRFLKNNGRVFVRPFFFLAPRVSTIRTSVTKPHNKYFPCHSLSPLKGAVKSLRTGL